MKNKLLPIIITSLFIIIFIFFYKGLKNSNIYTPETKIKNIITTPIHFSKENNTSGLSKKNIKEVTVTTALSLDDSMRKELMNYVSAQNNTNIELIEKVDESLIGGAIIRMGDTQLDASVSSKLKVLRQKFSENLYIENY